MWRALSSCNSYPVLSSLHTKKVRTAVVRSDLCTSICHASLLRYKCSDRSCVSTQWRRWLPIVQLSLNTNFRTINSIPIPVKIVQLKCFTFDKALPTRISLNNLKKNKERTSYKFTSQVQISAVSSRRVRLPTTTTRPSQRRAIWRRSTGPWGTSLGRCGSTWL